MTFNIDEKALEIAQRIADDYNICGVQVIAQLQLAAAEGIRVAFEPYNPVDYYKITPKNYRSITDVVLDAVLPSRRWSLKHDDTGTMLTLTRQRRYIAAELSRYIRHNSNEPSVEREHKLLHALKRAYGWVITCSQSPTAKADLKFIDQVIEEIEGTS